MSIAWVKWGPRVRRGNGSRYRGRALRVVVPNPSVARGYPWASSNGGYNRRRVSFRRSMPRQREVIRSYGAAPRAPACARQSPIIARWPRILDAATQGAVARHTAILGPISQLSFLQNCGGYLRWQGSRVVLDVIRWPAARRTHSRVQHSVGCCLSRYRNDMRTTTA